MRALGRALRTQSVPRRRASYRPVVETLEGRDLMSGGKITGVVFNDAITNGVRDAGELPLAGVTIFADSNANGILDAGEVSARSRADGSYTLALSQDGTFQPRQVEPLGFAETAAGAGAVALAGGATIGNINFGDRRTLPPNQSFVDQVFRDLLGRGADAGARAFFGGALDQGLLSRLQVGLIIENSTEFRLLQIDGLFRTLLHRPADPMGRQAFLNFFATGATTEQAEAVILASPEYFQTRGGSSTTGYATALFQDVFGRSIDSAGLASVQSFLAASGSRLNLTQALLASPEAQAREVRGLFQQLLHRDPDTGGLATFTAALHGGASDEHTAAVIASSDEYFQRFCL
jgi:hypothetical protein